MSTSIVPSPSSLETARAPQGGPWQRLDGAATATLLLCLAGLGVALYLTYIHYSHAEPICTPGGGCEAVNSSIYAKVGPVPVALLGAGMYLSLFMLTLLSRLREKLASAALLARFGVALAGVGYSAYLTYIALTVVQATCVWCLASFSIVTLVLVVSLWELVRPPAVEVAP